MNSNKACCWILAIIAGGTALTMLLIGYGISRAVSGGFSAQLGSEVKIEKNTWLMIKPTDVIPDYNAEPDLGFLGGSSGSSLNDMLRALDVAKDDPNISGVILRPMGVGGFASLRELRGALIDFKSSRKPVLAHFDFGTDRDYYLMSVADSIFMMPGRLSGLQFGGMAYSNTYLKNTFSKLGIKFHVFHAGKYKGAFEEFGRDSMSAELRTSIMSLYADVYQTYITESADARKKVSYDVLDHEVKEGKSYFVAGQECLSKGYVDALVEWAVLRKRLQGESKEFEAMSPRSYLSAKHEIKLDENAAEVAVLFAQGEISFGGDDQGWGDEGITATGLTAQLDELADDDDVKAVVLRVNSPGGSALASKQILESARRLKEKKPVVVSMGRVAASGGYYISMAANKIVVQPNTITGSIGVVSAIPTGEELYNKIGAREETVSIGRWANFFRFDKTLGPEQEQVLNSLMDSVYLEFREDVAAGRNLPIESLDSLAEGRVWTGNQAVERGLADTLGGIDVAVNIAAAEAGLDKNAYSVEYYPEKKDVFQFVIEKFSTKFDALLNVGAELRDMQSPKAVIHYLKNYFAKLEFLQTVLPLEVDA